MATTKLTFKANIDMPILYTYQLGGGIKRRTIKAGETVTLLAVMNDVNSQSVSTAETLHRIEANYFYKNFTRIN